jgi:hypothetical protein
LARLPLADSPDVTTLMKEVLRNIAIATFVEILMSPHISSLRSSGDLGSISVLIFSRTLAACPLVPEAMTIFDPGYSTALTQQYIAIKNDLPISFVIPSAFYLMVLMVSHKLSVHFLPL